MDMPRLRLKRDYYNYKDSDQQRGSELKKQIRELSKGFRSDNYDSKKVDEKSTFQLEVIADYLKKLDNLRIGVLGDLKHGRAVHSMMKLLTRYSKNHFTLISHASLALEAESKKDFEQHGCKIEETSDLEGAIKDLDILYVTRTQFERFDKDKLTKANDVYCVNKKLLAQGKKDLIVLHPLPRTGEIDPEIDELPQAKYFAQANCGVFIRMALLSLITNAK
jgi:aspartate carbamoyltransferase catalytic subunit